MGIDGNIECSNIERIKIKYHNLKSEIIIAIPPNAVTSIVVTSNVTKSNVTTSNVTTSNVTTSNAMQYNAITLNLVISSKGFVDR